VRASIPSLSQIHSSGTSFFTEPESIRRSSPQPGVDQPQSRLCARVPGELRIACEDIKERYRDELEPARVEAIISLSDAAIVSGTLDGKVTLWERGRNDYLRI
jgi:hypothetical protein